jgi:hypothetical protein
MKSAHYSWRKELNDKGIVTNVGQEPKIKWNTRVIDDTAIANPLAMLTSPVSTEVYVEDERTQLTRNETDCIIALDRQHKAETPRRTGILVLRTLRGDWQYALADSYETRRFVEVGADISQIPTRRRDLLTPS